VAGLVLWGVLGFSCLMVFLVWWFWVFFRSWLLQFLYIWRCVFSRQLQTTHFTV